MDGKPSHRHPGESRDPGPWRSGTPSTASHLTVIPAKAGIGTQARNLRAPSSQVVGAGLALLLLPYAFDLPAT